MLPPDGAAALGYRPLTYCITRVSNIVWRAAIVEVARSTRRGAVTGDVRAPQSLCHTRDTISKTHPMWHDMQWLSPVRPCLGRFPPAPHFTIPSRDGRFCLSCMGPGGCVCACGH